MSDDTTRRDSWSSSEASGETPSAAPPATPPAGAAGEPPNSSDRVGFCQDCGKPLTPATVRTVGTGVFCEPCLTMRVGATAPPSGYAAVPPYAPVPPHVPVPNEPSPVLAAILGLIPGVGAMYNGQFAKGIVHLAIFAILVSLSDNVNGIFGLFVTGWIFYMAFEAYHTAVARRDGLPVPNAFGFNDIGERMGFGKGWGGIHAARPSGTAMPPPPNAAPSSTPATNPTPDTNPYTAPVNTAPDWVGYIPPTAFATSTYQQQATAAPPAAQAYAQAPTDPGYGHVPYTRTYTGTSAGASSAAYGSTPMAGNTVPDTVTDLPARRFPAAALWLIGLGVLILIANVLPDWRLTGRWWLPVLFAGLSVWTFTRRMHTPARRICIIRWPVILMVLALMSALHAAYFPVTLWLTFSVLLIVFGALLVLERTAGAGPVYAPAYAPHVSAAPYTPSTAPDSVRPEEDNSRAAWTTAVGDPPTVDPNAPGTPKTGQSEGETVR